MACTSCGLATLPGRYLFTGGVRRARPQPERFVPGGKRRREPVEGRPAEDVCQGIRPPRPSSVRAPESVYTHPIVGGRDRAFSGLAGVVGRRIPASSNHGKKSSKFNQDCTICRTCRLTRSDSATPKWRENSIKWRV